MQTETAAAAPPWPNHVRAVREARGLDAAGLAAALGISESMLRRIEDGERALAGRPLHRLGESLGCRPDLLVVRPGETAVATSLKRLMAVRALAPRRLAEDSGLGQTAVRDIVEGRSRAPKPSTLAALARTLGVPVEELGARAREPGAAGRRVARPAAPSKRARHRDATRAPDEVVLVALADGSEVEVRCRRSMDAADWEAVRALAEVRRAAADGGREAGRRSAPAP